MVSVREVYLIQGEQTYLPSLTIVPFEMIGNVEANSGPQKIGLPIWTLLTRYSIWLGVITHDDVPELEGLILGGEHTPQTSRKEERRDTGTHGKQGLYKFAHDAAEDEAYEDSEQHWTMAPEPYPSVFPLENPDVTDRMAGELKIPNSLLDIKDKVEDPGGDSQAEEV
jgi:hypothetical protein